LTSVTLIGYWEKLDSVCPVLSDQPAGHLDGNSCAATLLKEAEKLINAGYRELLLIPA
jgi:hypothetical protein